MTGQILLAMLAFCATELSTTQGACRDQVRACMIHGTIGQPFSFPPTCFVGDCESAWGQHLLACEIERSRTVAKPISNR